MKRRNKGWPANVSGAKHATFNVAAIDRALSSGRPSDVVDLLRRDADATSSGPAAILWRQAADEIERLRKGECICIRCGQRQDAATDDHPKF